VQFGLQRAVLGNEVIDVVETLEASPERSARRIHPCVLSSHKPNWAIVLSIVVDADARRISQALTEPEYLEAWISMPDQSEGSRIVASKKANGYQLDHCRTGSVIASIIGSFLFCHQRKMRLSWRNATVPDTAESLVDFRIRGNFASSIIELRHTAFPSAGEFLWHRELWRASLARLASILRSA
jgi:hypothetical protein